MVAVALVSNTSPSPLALELEEWGYKVYEALSVADVLHLCDYIEPAAIVVSRDVDVEAVADLAQRHIVIEQHEGCTTEQILETLTMMFGHPAPRQQ